MAERGKARRETSGGEGGGTGGKRGEIKERDDEDGEGPTSAKSKALERLLRTTRAGLEAACVLISQSAAHRARLGRPRGVVKERCEIDQGCVSFDLIQGQEASAARENASRQPQGTCTPVWEVGSGWSRGCLPAATLASSCETECPILHDSCSRDRTPLPHSSVLDMQHCAH